MSQQKHTKSA